jgi:hypothetical protein
MQEFSLSEARQVWKAGRKSAACGFLWQICWLEKEIWDISLFAFKRLEWFLP